MERIVLTDNEGVIVVVLRYCRFCKTFTRFNSFGWVQPCQCPGFVHQRCALEWVGVCEARGRPFPPCCPWCLALYRVEPPVGPFLAALHTVARVYYPLLCNVLAYTAYQVLVDVCFNMLGFFVLCRIYGTTETHDYLQGIAPLQAVSLCHSVAMAAILVNYIPWEDYALRLLRKCSKLPVLGLVLPQGGPDERIKHHPLATFGSLTEACILPALAELTGHLLFRSEPSLLKRFLLGGATFLLARGVVYMYYKQRKFVRQNTLRVVDYTPQNTPTPAT